MAKVFSLTTVTVVIENDNHPMITIGGAGKLLGSVGYEYEKDMYSMDSSPDGGYVGNFNGSKQGKVKVLFKQTSFHIAELTEFCLWARANPSLALSKITITDSLGNIAATCNGCLPVRIPANTVGETAGTREFEFVSGEIISEEKNV
ncbi:MAG: hypothetical protein RR342_01200 [Bacilli bacterium]